MFQLTYTNVPESPLSMEKLRDTSSPRHSGTFNGVEVLRTTLLLVSLVFLSTRLILRDMGTQNTFVHINLIKTTRFRARENTDSKKFKLVLVDNCIGIFDLCIYRWNWQVRKLWEREVDKTLGMLRGIFLCVPSSFHQKLHLRVYEQRLLHYISKIRWPFATLWYKKCTSTPGVPNIYGSNSHIF